MLYAGALLVYSVTDSDEVRRLLWATLIVCVFLYEPILVAMAGGTIGHWLMNLRVVDNQSGGNLGLLKALARTVIKDLLGWLSFVTMAVARRHQSLHDIFTNSTVQVREASKSRLHHFAQERSADDMPGLPSRLRRVVVILLYVVASYPLLSIGAILFVSDACARGRCDVLEVVVSFAVGACWLVLVVWFVRRGWAGRLFGCRKAPVPDVA